MKPDPTSTKNSPTNSEGAPNDDGFVLGTAGRDEDPNATTDWNHDSDATGNNLSPDDARGLPGYPRESKDDLGLPPNGRPETGIETPEKDNDKAG
jgi:hypothetical protein